MKYTLIWIFLSGYLCVSGPPVHASQFACFLCAGRCRNQLNQSYHCVLIEKLTTFDIHNMSVWLSMSERTTCTRYPHCMLLMCLQMHKPAKPILYLFSYWKIYNFWYTKHVWLINYVWQRHLCKLTGQMVPFLCACTCTNQSLHCVPIEKSTTI